MEVNGYCQLSGYQHFFKYLLWCSIKDRFRFFLFNAMSAFKAIFITKIKLQKYNYHIINKQVILPVYTIFLNNIMIKIKKNVSGIILLNMSLSEVTS